MTDDQKPFDDDLTFDDVPVVPEDPRAQVDGDDFLDEVDEAEQAGDFLTEPPEEGPTFAVHHRGAELFPAQAAQDVDQEGEDVSGEEPSAELELDAEPADPETGPTDELGFDSRIDADDELEGSAVDQTADDYLAEGEGDSEGYNER